MPQTTSPLEHFPCELVSWEKFDELTQKLLEKIVADGFVPDLIIAVVRGGYLPARLLSNHLARSSQRGSGIPVDVAKQFVRSSEKRKSS